MRLSRSPTLLAALLVLAPAGASATVVSGRVTNTSGQGVANVDLDFVDPGGTSIPLTGDATDALGYYAVTVPADTYVIRCEPAAGDRLVATADPGIVVGGASQVFDRVLQSGFFVSARVVDDTGVPQPGARLRVTVDPGGASIHVPYDTTDAAGQVTAVLPAGSFDLLFRPAVIGPLLSVIVPGVAVTGDLDLGDVVLGRGIGLGGRVVGEDGPALSGVSVVAVDAATGLEPPGGRTSTSATGGYQLWVLPGTYRLDALPPTGSTYISRSLHGLVVTADRVLRDLVLDRGVLATGQVIDTRPFPVNAVDLDFDDVLSGLRVPTPHDNTDATGAYGVAVRRGTYDVGFEPPAGSGLASARLDAQVILADTTLPTVTLAAGFAVTGRVLAPGGSPAPNVDVDAIVPASGVKLPLGDDQTSAAGTFSVIVPAGTFDFDFDPPALSGWGRAAMPGVAIGGPRNLGDIQLPASSSASALTMAPASGPETGGTSVTLTGGGFVAGARVVVGGVPLTNVVVSPTNITGITGRRPAGLVDVEVTNPGAMPAVLAGAFTYDPVSPDAVIHLRRDGPLDNDIRIDWAPIAQPALTVFRSTDMFTFGEDQIIGAAARSWRDEGGLLVPGLVFWVVR